MNESVYLGKNISIAYRLCNRFYDRELAPYQIGSGQQFFLLRIYEHDGISMYDLARLGQFDKGTVTRAARKLEELGYIRSEADGHDKRVRRLNVTEKAGRVVRAVYDARARWNALLTQGIAEEELAQARSLLEQMAENAQKSLEQEETEFGTNTDTTAEQSPGV